jgi:hypothetical protein
MLTCFQKHMLRKYAVPTLLKVTKIVHQTVSDTASCRYFFGNLCKYEKFIILASKLDSQMELIPKDKANKSCASVALINMLKPEIPVDLTTSPILVLTAILSYQVIILYFFWRFLIYVSV